MERRVSMKRDFVLAVVRRVSESSGVNWRASNSNWTKC